MAPDAGADCPSVGVACAARLKEANNTMASIPIVCFMTGYLIEFVFVIRFIIAKCNDIIHALKILPVDFLLTIR
jgi:hypothetical protein